MEKSKIKSREVVGEIGRIEWCFEVINLYFQSKKIYK